MQVKKAKSVSYNEEPINVHALVLVSLELFAIINTTFLEAGKGGVRKQRKDLMALQRRGRESSLA